MTTFVHIGNQTGRANAHMLLQDQGPLSSQVDYIIIIKELI
jgi:hypothetical protein